MIRVIIVVFLWCLIGTKVEADVIKSTDKNVTLSAKEGRINAARTLKNKFDSPNAFNFDIRVYAKGKDCDVMHVETSNFMPTMMEALAKGDLIYGQVIPNGINSFAQQTGFKAVLYTSRADNSFVSYYSGSKEISRKQIIKMNACRSENDKKVVLTASEDSGKKLIHKINKQYGLHSFYSVPTKAGGKMVITLPEKAWRKLSAEQQSSIESYMKSISVKWAISVGKVSGTDIIEETYIREN